MPTPWVRDLELARRKLGEWMRTRIPEAEDLRLSALTQPGTSGFSNETLLVDAEWREAGSPRREELVIRVQPIGFQVFPEYDMRLQYRTLELLEPTDVPVPPALWFEERDESVLDAPFYVMGRVRGRVPSDNPPYNAEGWLGECTPEEIASVWWGCIECLAKIHALDHRATGFGFLERPELGKSPLERQLTYYRRYLDWMELDAIPPAVEAGLAWLERHQPADEPTGLVWGDARIGNILYDGVAPAAVLDWEMATLGSPEMDLGWTILVDRFHSEGLGLARRPGFPGYEETVARYEELSGHRVRHLHYYQVLAGLRFSVIMMRLTQQLAYYEALDEEQERAFVLAVPVMRLLARDLGLPEP